MRGGNIECEIHVFAGESGGEGRLGGHFSTMDYWSGGAGKMGK